MRKPLLTYLVTLDKTANFLEGNEMIIYWQLTV